MAEAPSPDNLYMMLGQLVAEISSFTSTPDSETVKWIGRLVSILESTNDRLGIAEVNAASMFLRGSNYQQSADTITRVLYTALARAELHASAGFKGKFVPAGNAHDAFVAVSKIIEQAKGEVLFVDPYADHSLLEKFAPLVKEGLLVRILADSQYVKKTLGPAHQAWVSQYGARRPLETMVSPAKALHDRSILIDKTVAYALGQSFNALAVRSPTTVTRLDAETAALKIEAYEDVWKRSAPI